MANLKVVTFRETSQYFVCLFCQQSEKRTYIVGRWSFESRTHTHDGQYTGMCIFKNVVNVLTEEQQVNNIHQEIKCVRCKNRLGSKYVQLPPLYAHRTGSFYLITMANVYYWDGDNFLDAEAGLPAVLAELVQDPGSDEAQVQPVDGDPDNEDEDDDEFPPGAWYFG